jgi:hypothetical protein
MAFVTNGTYSLGEGAYDEFTLVMYKAQDAEDCFSNTLTEVEHAAV